MRLRLFAPVAVIAMSLMTTALPAIAANPALTYEPVPSWWGTNDRVSAILPSGNRIYIAGGFDYVGPTTGYGVGVDSTGKVLPGAPLIDGSVKAAVPDGQGGWYIGGDFSFVGGQYRLHAAQVTADGTVTGWFPKPDGTVNAIAVVGNSVVLGGSFANVGSQSVTAASRLAAVDKVNGDPVPGWSATANNTVRGLLPAAGSVYAVGDFTNVDGQVRGGVARLSASSGALDSSFSATTSGSVYAAALSPAGDTLYVGGSFTAAGSGSPSSSRARLAAFSTGSSALTSWAPAVDSTVLALATDPASGDVYAGGLFGTVNGAARTRLADLGSDGSLRAFDAGLNGCSTPHITKYGHSNPPCTPEVDSLLVSNGSLYVGGRFGATFGTPRHDLAAFALSGGAVTSWNPIASNRVLALAPSNGSLFLGGDFTSVNGAVRKGIAALNATTGALDPTFDADTNDEVVTMALSPSGDRLYIGGHFTTVRGQPHKLIASLLTTDGTPDPAFKAAPNQDVFSVQVAGGALYAAGQFTRIGSVPRQHTAKLSLVDGSVDPTFLANTVGPTGRLTAGGMVQTMVVTPDGSRVFLGGPFDTVNGAAQHGIAVVDGRTGGLLPHQLGGVHGCWAGGDWITQLYLSPDGQRLYGGDECPDWVYQWDAVNLSTTKTNGLNWDTLCNAGMQGTLEINGHFYYGTHGGDRNRGGYCWATPNGGPAVSQQRYFVFDSASGNLLPDHPEFDSPMGVWAIAAVPQGLLVGGDFTFAGARHTVHQGLVLFPGTP